ncbi:MAG: glycosyltransferase, partial [candidate division Zixibacteria bacterium]|nr:glycosyltransferase [candidate division Zixibacteria bacterium]
MSTLSVILITNNEVNNIRRALDSVRFADEIIINDSGSTDGTLEIAKAYGC